MLSIANHESKRQQHSVGGGGRQLTTLAITPPQVAFELAVVVPTDIEHTRQVIVAGVAPPHKPSADKKK